MIQSTLDGQPDQLQYNVQVMNVVLWRTSPDELIFDGMATMTSNGGPARDIPVHVIFDQSRNVQWSIAPGAMAPLFQ